MLKRRVAIFKGREGWFSTREFIGDKTELESVHSQDTCEANWKSIARVLQNAKTIKDFQQAAQWVQHLYHSSTPTQTQNAPEVPKGTLLQASRALEKNPDEMLIVYEDLGATGIKSFCRCPNCGRAYPLTYKPDGTVPIPTIACLSCGIALDWAEPMPSTALWGAAIKMYHEAPATYKIGDGEIHDIIAREHQGCPVKILKIVGFDNGKMIFEVQFRDWKTALVWDTELVPFQESAIA